MSNRRSQALAMILVTALVLVGSHAIRGESAGDSGSLDARNSMSALNWLAGNWSGSMWGGEFVAYYSTSEGGRVIGQSALIKEGQEVFYEFEVFSIKGDKVVLSPFPRGVRKVELVATDHDVNARRIVFENPEKDYPTRIVYYRKADDNLVITLSDPHGKSEKQEVFDLKRR
ncbi:MAG: DUF6265 family protein [Planctomycetota bacterium]